MSILINGKELKKWYSIVSFRFSPDSKKFVYVSTDKENAYLIENEKILKKEEIRYYYDSEKKYKL